MKISKLMSPKYEELKEKCRSLGLKVSGRKIDLKRRVKTYKDKGKSPPKENTNPKNRNKMADMEKEEIIVDLSDDETHIADYCEADDESENNPKHKRRSNNTRRNIDDMKCYTPFGLKTLNYDKAVDLPVTERLKNSKLHEKLQKLEIENENLKSANRPKSQVKAATHAHVEQSRKMKLLSLCQLPSLGLVLLCKKQVSHVSSRSHKRQITY